MDKQKKSYNWVGVLAVFFIFFVIGLFSSHQSSDQQSPQPDATYNYLVEVQYPSGMSTVRCYDLYGIAINSSVSEFNHSFFDAIMPVSKYLKKVENNVLIVYKINTFEFRPGFPILENPDFKAILNNWTGNEINCRTFIPYKQWKYDIYDNGNKQTKSFMLRLHELSIDCIKYDKWECKYTYDYQNLDNDPYLSSISNSMEGEILNYNFEGF